MARVLITGCRGFVGTVLSARMAESGAEVWGVDRTDGDGDARYVKADLTDEGAVRALIEDVDPQVIVHLAAQSSVRRSFDEPYETIIHNTTPTLNILNCLRAAKNRRLLAIGSADEYGIVAPEELPLKESSPVSPSSPYALAKSIQNQCCRGFATLYGVDVLMTRSFNHTGAGQSDVFVLPSFAKQVVEVKLGQREPVMRVGNLSAKRDFLDVRDVCDAYSALIEHGEAGETYNVCSGQAYKIEDLLTRLCELADVQVSVETDPAKLRPVDMEELRGDATRLRELTGWEPLYTIDDTLRSLLEYWEQRLTANTSTN